VMNPSNSAYKIRFWQDDGRVTTRLRARWAPWFIHHSLTPRGGVCRHVVLVVFGQYVCATRLFECVRREYVERDYAVSRLKRLKPLEPGCIRSLPPVKAPLAMHLQQLTPRSMYDQMCINAPRPRVVSQPFRRKPSPEEDAISYQERKRFNREVSDPRAVHSPPPACQVAHRLPL
jgi:hypothetical protein